MSSSSRSTEKPITSASRTGTMRLSHLLLCGPSTDLFLDDFSAHAGGER